MKKTSIDETLIVGGLATDYFEDILNEEPDISLLDSDSTTEEIVEALNSVIEYLSKV